MKTLPTIALFTLVALMTACGTEIASVPHLVVAEDRTFVRDITYKRYSIWTDSDAQISEIVSSLGIKNLDAIKLKPGEIFAVFVNDRIEEDLVQVAQNKATKQYFADYADSGVKFKLRPLSGDKKYSHLTAVIFSPSQTPSHLGMRGMISNGLSEKK